MAWERKGEKKRKKKKRRIKQQPNKMARIWMFMTSELSMVDHIRSIVLSLSLGPH